MPHPMKGNSQGKPDLIVPILLYIDDTSGNISKKWHAFNIWCFLLVGLPRHINSQLQNIHFICWSDRVTAIKMAEPIVHELKFLKSSGVLCYNGFLNCSAIVLACVIGVMCDNHQASELLNHAGSIANKYCCICTMSSYLLYTYL